MGTKTLENYFSKQNKIIQEDREKTLIHLGLVEKEYSPNGSKSKKYDKIDNVNGEQKYYRNVPMKVTDEEYALIVEKAKQVEAIRRKEEIEKEQKQAETESSTGKSIIASVLRFVAWVSFIVLFIFGIRSAVSAKDFVVFLLYFGIGGMSLLIPYAIASILDYLAELTAIAKSGFKYSDTKKK